MYLKEFYFQLVYGQFCKTLVMYGGSLVPSSVWRDVEAMKADVEVKSTPWDSTFPLDMYFHLSCTNVFNIALCSKM